MSADRALDEAGEAALQAEHDQLARALAVRRSIDVMRRFAYAAFATFLASGLTAKLAWDRWFSARPTRFRGSPALVLVALAVTLGLAAISAILIVRARRLMRSEDALFARMRELRDRLELDP